MGQTNYIEDRLVQIATEREEVLVRLADVREKMKRADSKRTRQSDTPNYTKWSGILRKLEHDHDKYKAILTTLESEAKTKAAKLAELQAESNAHLAKLEENYKRCMGMSFSERASTTAEEKELFREYQQMLQDEEVCGPEDTDESAPTPVVTKITKDERPNDVVVSATASPQAEANVNEIRRTANGASKEQPAAESEATETPAPEPTGALKADVTPTGAARGVTDPTSAAAPPSVETDAKQRRKQVFQSAIEKSSKSTFTALTFEEANVLLTAYRTMLSRPPQNADAKKMHENISGAMWEINVQCSRICASWAAIVQPSMPQHSE